MSNSLFFIILSVYFIILMAIARLTRGRADNDAFFRGNRSSRWYVVAFGMIGASLSGVTFVSVPGMVQHISFTYLQTCMGFFAGYLVIAFVLLPVYYSLNLTSIYTYLERRFGRQAYKTGASFFLLSKGLGAAARLYLVCVIIQRFVCDAWNIPFALTAAITLLLIYLYTRQSGIRSIVWTDTLQTFCLIAALVMILFQTADKLNLDFGGVCQLVSHDSRSQVWLWDDWTSKQHFVKQFFSGMFITIVMTGLDQDMMQKNLTCRTLKEAQKNMCTYGFSFLPVNLLFLVLGLLLLHAAPQLGMALPQGGDQLLPAFIERGVLGKEVGVLFAIGIIAAAFSSADSALTALTTSFCVDIMNNGKSIKLRKMVHIGITASFILFIMLFRWWNNASVIDTIFVLASYSYGPLLGLFCYGLFTHRCVANRLVPYIALGSPILCWAVQWFCQHQFQYAFGYELLMLNGLITFVALWVTGKKGNDKQFNGVERKADGRAECQQSAS